jgi:hypothetical protein
MNDESERIWKEAMLASFEALHWNLYWGTAENHEYLRIIDFSAKIRTTHLQNTDWKRYLLSQFVLSKDYTHSTN